MSNEEFMNRRRFFRGAATLLGAGGVALLGGSRSAIAAPPVLTLVPAARALQAQAELEKEHLLNIRMPVIAEDGANIPIIVSMDHPMDPDHYIESIQIINFNDPVVNKGVYHFTPANGQAFIANQIRMDGGDVEVFVIARCTKHGRWVGNKQLKVSLGGC